MTNPYPAYKPSGIDWLGQIPAHWEVKKLKYLLSLIKNGAPKSALRIAVENIESKTGKLVNLPDEMTAQSDAVGFQPGDVVFNKLRPYLAKVYYADQLGGSLGELLILRSKGELYGKYTYYRLLSDEFIGTVNSSTEGTKMPRANWDDFIAHLKLAFPPLAEQTAIANYLDRKTARIDDLLAQKRELISLLQEERAGLINDTVTQGLNHRAPRKDSGLPWLGQIPAHWEVKKLKYVVRKVGSGITPSGGASSYQLSGIPLLRSQNIHNNELRLDDVAYISEKIDADMAYSRVYEDDVLLNITGASIGRCHYWPKDFGRANVNQHVCIIRPNRSLVLTKFLHAILIANYGQTLIDSYQSGANREGLNFFQIRNFDLPVPPLAEQAEIVAHIEMETAQIDATIQTVEQKIALLTE